MQIHIDPDTGRQAEQSLINFVWLLKLRWVAALGQLATVLTVDLLLGVELPLHYLLPLIAFEALSNLVFAGWLRLIDRRGGFGEDSLSTVEALLAAVMVLDLLLLTALLFATGGPSNPFCLFYLVNVLLGSLVLRPLWSFGLMGFGVLCFTLLFYAHEPLPGLPPLAGGLTAWEMHEAWQLYLAGALASFALLAITLLYFFTRLRRELGELELELDVAKEQRERSKRLEAMATLAAGAAHELSTPLSTIAVVANELQRDLERGGDLAHATEDARLIRQEVQRCRSILDQMSSDAGESAGEGLQKLSISELLAEVMEGCKDESRVELQVDVRIADAQLSVPRTALVQALRNLVHNGIDASERGQLVEFSAEQVDGGVLIAVRDQGHGMDAETLERAGSPFFTTKEVGQGMGLGLFLTRSVLDRLGARFGIESQEGLGTVARVWFGPAQVS
jgi:two-component system sensor histidine kinase RegB